MAHKRVVRVISIEGNDEWVDKSLRSSIVHPNKTFFTGKGTVKELQRIELREGEELEGLLKARER